jgi:hypothetical protein
MVSTATRETNSSLAADKGPLMRKRVKTTPLQREILRALVSEGHRSLPALLHDLQGAFPVDSYAMQLERLERSLAVLIRMGCVYLARIVDSEKKQFFVDEMNQLSLEKLVRWDETTRGWNFQSLEPMVTDIVVQLTKGGVEELELASGQKDT